MEKKQKCCRCGDDAVYGIYCDKPECLEYMNELSDEEIDPEDDNESTELVVLDNNVEEPKRQVDWTITHQRIEKFYLMYAKKHMTHPTKQQVADGIGMNRKTIERHWYTISFEQTKEMMGHLRNEFILAWIRDAKARGVVEKDIRLYVQLFDGQLLGDEGLNTDNNIVIINNIP